MLHRCKTHKLALPVKLDAGGLAVTVLGHDTLAAVVVGLSVVLVFALASVVALAVKQEYDIRVLLG